MRLLLQRPEGVELIDMVWGPTQAPEMGRPAVGLPRPSAPADGLACSDTRDPTGPIVGAVSKHYLPGVRHPALN